MTSPALRYVAMMTSLVRAALLECKTVDVVLCSALCNMLTIKGLLGKFCPQPMFFIAAPGWVSVLWFFAPPLQ